MQLYRISENAKITRSGSGATRVIREGVTVYVKQGDMLLRGDVVVLSGDNKLEITIVSTGHTKSQVLAEHTSSTVNEDDTNTLPSKALSPTQMHFLSAAPPTAMLNAASVTAYETMPLLSVSPASTPGTNLTIEFPPMVIHTTQIPATIVSLWSASQSIDLGRVLANIQNTTPPAPVPAKQSFTLTSGADSFIGTDHDDTFTTTVANLSSNDVLTGNAGMDSLILTGGGTFSFSNSFNATLIGIENIALTAGFNYVITLGSDFNAITTLNGGALLSSDTLTVDASALTQGVNITGGAGADTVTLSSGNDTVNLGAGDDTINIYDAGFSSLDALNAGSDNGVLGLGDALRLTGSGQTLNLMLLHDAVIQDIETIDLTGTGNNFLAFNTTDALALSSTTDNLVVKGNAGDQVTISTSAGGWTQGADQLIDGKAYHFYTSDTGDNAQAYIDATITIIVN